MAGCATSCTDIQREERRGETNDVRPSNAAGTCTLFSCFSSYLSSVSFLFFHFLLLQLLLICNKKKKISRNRKGEKKHTHSNGTKNRKIRWKVVHLRLYPHHINASRRKHTKHKKKIWIIIFRMVLRVLMHSCTQGEDLFSAVCLLPGISPDTSLLTQKYSECT